MTIHKHPQPDDFDALIAQSLQAQVAQQYPPRRVWRRIRSAIAGRGSPRLPRWRWSMAAQVVMAVLVLFGSRFALEKTDERLTMPTASHRTQIVSVVAAPGKSDAIVVKPERQQLRAMRISEQHQPHPVATPPIDLPPTDVVRLNTVIDSTTVPAVSVIGFAPRQPTGGVLR